MARSSKGTDYQKFLTMDEEKREIIFHAALKEFSAGYKKATTDNIAFAAGISKGLLFHHFGTKENLYRIVLEHSLEIVKKDFYSQVNIDNPDVLDSVWQMAIIKHKLSVCHPAIFDFLAAAYFDEAIKNEVCGDLLTSFKELAAKTTADIYENADRSLLRDDIDPKKTIDIIYWVVAGYAGAKEQDASRSTSVSSIRDNYDSFLKEYEAYLDILRKCFYK